MLNIIFTNKGTKNIAMKLTTNTNVKTIRSKSSNKIPKPETKKVKKVNKKDLKKGRKISSLIFLFCIL